MQTNDRDFSSKNSDQSQAFTPSSPAPDSSSSARTPESFETSVETREKRVIPLLEERLHVNRQRRKIGEVILRREVETRIIEVPVRREKLIVEQISPEFRQIACIDFPEAEISNQEGNTPDLSEQTLTAYYATPQAASYALKVFDQTLANQCQSVSLAIVVQKGDRPEQTSHQFETLATATQFLDAMESFLRQFTAAAPALESHAIVLKLVAPPDVLHEVYRAGTEQGDRSPGSALSKARRFFLA